MHPFVLVYVPVHGCKVKIQLLANSLMNHYRHGWDTVTADMIREYKPLNPTRVEAWSLTWRSSSMETRLRRVGRYLDRRLLRITSLMYKE